MLDMPAWMTHNELTLYGSNPAFKTLFPVLDIDFGPPKKNNMCREKITNMEMCFFGPPRSMVS